MKNFLLIFVFALVACTISANQTEVQQPIAQSLNSAPLDQAKEAYDKAIIAEKIARENFIQARGLDKKNAQEVLAVAQNTTMLTKQAFDRARAKAANN
jgi:hypothetical protein